jgi:hypothetical protein
MPRPGVQRAEGELRARHLEKRNASLDEEQPDRPPGGSADAGRGAPVPNRGAGVAAHLAYLQGRGPAPDVGSWARWDY